MNFKMLYKKITGFIKIIKSIYKHFLLLTLLGSSMRAMIPFLGLFFSAQILNCFIQKQYDFAIRYIFTMILSEFAAGLIGKICYERLKVIQNSIDAKVKQKLTSKAFVLQYDNFERQSTLEELQKAELSLRGLGGIGSQIEDLMSIMESLFGLIFAIGFTIMLFVQMKQGEGSFFLSYGLIAVLIIAYIGAILFYVDRNEKSGNLFTEMQKKNDYVNSLWGYMMNLMLNQKNAKDIRIFQMQPYFLNKVENISNQALGIYEIIGSKTGIHFAQSAFVAQMISALAYIVIGIKALQGIIPIGNVLLYVGAINQIGTQFLMFAMIFAQFMARAEVLDTYTKFINRQAMSYDGSLPIEKRDDGEYLFEFCDVSFTYPDTTKEILSHVDLKFSVKEKMAIVGRNGAGKSTLIKLLCRLYEPTGGKITLNGIDIRKYKYQEYVKVFSVVFQDFELFSTPLGENIAGKKQIEEEEIYQALDKVQMKEKVKKMSDQLSTRLYNNNGKGIDISGGEAQKIAIARALYKDAPFVILDEPTAALDPFAESQIYENFNQMIENKTAIYISHRMSSCKFCNRIVVFDQGKVCEEGTHEQLLSQHGIYAKLYETQAQYYA